jgi:hypothetical protein
LRLYQNAGHRQHDGKSGDGAKHHRRRSKASESSLPHEEVESGQRRSVVSVKTGQTLLQFCPS